MSDTFHLNPCHIKYDSVIRAAIEHAVDAQRAKLDKDDPRKMADPIVWDRYSYYHLEDATIRVLGDGIVQVTGTLPLHHRWYGSPMFDSPKPPDVPGGWPTRTVTRHWLSPARWFGSKTYEEWKHTNVRVGEFRIDIVIPSKNVTGNPP